MTADGRAGRAGASRSIVSQQRRNLKSGGRAAALHNGLGAAAGEIAPRYFIAAGSARFAPRQKSHSIGL
jgi:hypothetical protein